MGIARELYLEAQELADRANVAEVRVLKLIEYLLDWREVMVLEIPYMPESPARARVFLLIERLEGLEELKALVSGES